MACNLFKYSHGCGRTFLVYLFIAIHYKFKLPTYIQEPLVMGRRGYLHRDLNGEMVSIR